MRNAGCLWRRYQQAGWGWGGQAEGSHIWSPSGWAGVCVRARVGGRRGSVGSAYPFILCSGSFPPHNPLDPSPLPPHTNLPLPTPARPPAPPRPCQVLTLFKGFVSTNRPGLDIDSVATGEIWFGPDALKKNLVDELVTSDDVLTRHVADGYDVFSVKYMPKPSSPLAALTGAAAGGWQGALVGLVARAILPATPVGGVAADELTRQALGGRPRGAEARWVDDSAPMLRAEGMGGSAEQPSWGWDDDFA